MSDTDDQLLTAIADAVAALPEDVLVPDCAIRERSCRGEPAPRSQFARRCRACGADFLGLAPGRTGLRGIWQDWQWFCSRECHNNPSKQGSSR